MFSPLVRPKTATAAALKYAECSRHQHNTKYTVARIDCRSISLRKQWGGLLGSWGARVLAPVPTMDEFTRAHPYTGILLLGDFNQLPNFQLKPSPLQQIVTCPTRGNSILAKIYTNVTNWCQTPIIPKIHVSPSIFDNTTSSQPF